MESLGARIAEARKARKLSQADLAARMGVNRVTVATWEGAGRLLPSLTHAVQLARVLRVSLDWLATGQGPTPTRKRVARSTTHPDAADL